MPTRKALIKTKVQIKLEKININLPGSILSILKLSTDEKVLLSYILSLTNHNPTFFATNEFIGILCNCCKSKASNLINKIENLGYIKFESFDGRYRIYAPTEKLKNLNVAVEYKKYSNSNSTTPPAKKQKHILKEITKSINTLNYKNKKEIGFFVKSKINNADEFYLNQIDEALLLECKKIYLDAQFIKGTNWDAEHQRYLPLLIYNILSTFLKDETEDKKKLIEIFKILLTYPSKKFTNTIPSYFKIYNYWIEEAQKKSFELINRIINVEKNKNETF